MLVRFSRLAVFFFVLFILVSSGYGGNTTGAADVFSTVFNYEVRVETVSSGTRTLDDGISVDYITVNYRIFYAQDVKEEKGQTVLINAILYDSSYGSEKPSTFRGSAYHNQIIVHPKVIIDSQKHKVIIESKKVTIEFNTPSPPLNKSHHNRHYSKDNP